MDYEITEAERELRRLVALCRQLHEAEQTKNQKDWTMVIRELENVGKEHSVEDIFDRCVIEPLRKRTARFFGGHEFDNDGVCIHCHFDGAEHWHLTTEITGRR